MPAAVTAPPPPLTLRGWKARRAGGRITVTGIDIETNADAKIVGVENITPPADHSKHEVVATDRHGTIHRLIFA